MSWHAQLQWPGLALEEGRLYTVEFSAPLGPAAAPSCQHPSQQVRLAPLRLDGRRRARAGVEHLQLPFPRHARRAGPGPLRPSSSAAGRQASSRSRTSRSRRGGSLGLKPGESLEAGSVAVPAPRPSPLPGGWTGCGFLAETERAYTDGLRVFLKNDLGVEAAIIDTQASYGGITGTYRESFNDFIDMHAYWQHPHFPGRPVGWGQLAHLQLAHERGQERRQPRPPRHLPPRRQAVHRLRIRSPRPQPLLGRDVPHARQPSPPCRIWDGLFQFDWGGTDPDARRITGYFALQQHPAKLAFLPAAALMFRRGDVAPARGTARLSIPAGQVEQLSADGVSMSEAWKQAGVTASNMFNHRLELTFTPSGTLAATVTPAAASPVAWDTPGRDLHRGCSGGQSRCRALRGPGLALGREPSST